MDKKSISTRRHQFTRKVKHNDHSFLLSFGIDPDTHQLIEVFYSDGMKIGTDLQHSVQDACIIISLLLQHDVPIENIQKSLSTNQNGDPASIVGAIARAVEEENDQLSSHTP